MSKLLNVLLVNDSDDATESLLHRLQSGGYAPRHERVDTPEAMNAALDRQAWDIVLSSYVLPRFSAIAMLELLRERGLDVPVIIVSDTGGEDVAVKAMKAGASDYMMSTESARLVPAVDRELAEAERRRTFKRTETDIELRVHQQAIVANLGIRALAGIDLQVLMDEAVSQVCQALNVEYCMVLELLPGGNSLFLRTGKGWKEGLVRQVTVEAERNSLAGYTLLSREPVIVDDLRTETRFDGPKFLHDHGVVSSMSVIIHGKDNPYGILGAHTTKRQVFASDDVYFLQAAANVLAEAIGRKQTEERMRDFSKSLEKNVVNRTEELNTITEELKIITKELKKKNDELLAENSERELVERKLNATVEERNQNIRELSNLMSFSSLMSEETQEKVLLKHMALTLREHFSPDVLAVLMLDSDKKILDVPIIDPPMPATELIKDKALLDPSLCRVVRTGQAVVVRDVSNAPSCECVIHEIKEGGYTCIPLSAGGATIGVVLVIKKEPNYWNSEDRLRLLTAYVGLTASALHKVRLMEIAKRSAITDALTGVYNRRFFDEIMMKHLSLAKRRKEPLGLLLGDVDYFKQFNDTFGHLVGDNVLRQITRILLNSVRNSDTVARYGGEEFAIIMPTAGIDKVIEKAEDIRKNIESANFDNIVPGQTLKLTMSFGVATYPDHGAKYETFVNAADKALYRAKEGGRNRVEAPDGSVEILM